MTAVALAVVGPGAGQRAVLEQRHHVDHDLHPSFDAMGQPQQRAGRRGVPGRPPVVRPSLVVCTGRTTSRSWTTSQPVGVCQVVSSTIVPGM